MTSKTKKCRGSGETFLTRESYIAKDGTVRVLCNACWRSLKSLKHPGSNMYIVVPQHNPGPKDGFIPDEFSAVEEIP